MCNTSQVSVIFDLLSCDHSHIGYRIITCWFHFQPNRRPGSDSGNQKESIKHVSKSCALNLPLDELFQVTFLKSGFLGYSNKNTSLNFLQKNWWSYGVQHCTHGTPLHAASSNGHISAVALLLDHGADVNMTNSCGRTALSEAFESHHLEVMQSLLGHGAAPDVQHNHFGLLTHSASSMGQAKVICLLLQHNANVNATALYNYTPLHWVSMNRHVNIAQVLLDHGADVNTQSNFGTPLYLASTNDHLEAACLLLVRGAAVHIRAPCGLTPFQASGGA